MKLYLVRHGQTWFNQIGRIQGWCDSPLTKKGQEQALHLRHYFDSIPLQAGFYSGSERAGDTLELILGQRDIPCFKDKRFKEVFFGEWEARRMKDVFPDGKVEVERFYEHGGEHRHNAALRFEAACMDVSHRYSGDVLIVSHGSVIRQFLEEHSTAFRDFSSQGKSTGTLVPNCSVSILSVCGDTLEVLQLPFIPE